MVVGILQIELAIEWAGSLKDKRRVVNSLKDRLHREHQVSVAEVEALDEPRRAIIGITLAANSVPRAQSVLDRLLEKLGTHPDCYVSDHRIEILSGR